MVIVLKYEQTVLQICVKQLFYLRTVNTDSTSCKSVNSREFFHSGIYSLASLFYSLASVL